MVRPTLLAFLYFYRTFSDLFRLPDARPLASRDLRVSSNSFFSSSLPNSDASTSRPSPRFFCSLSHPLSLLQIQTFRSQAQDHPRRVSFCLEASISGLSMLTTSFLIVPSCRFDGILLPGEMCLVLGRPYVMVDSEEKNTLTDLLSRSFLQWIRMLLLLEKHRKSERIFSLRRGRRSIRWCRRC